MADNIVVFITCSSKKEALNIKDILLKEKKAACVNILGGIDSFFWWKNRIDSCREILLIIKSKRKLFNKIVALVKKAHKYEVPEIIALPIVEGNKDYLDWIGRSVKN